MPVIISNYGLICDLSELRQLFFRNSWVIRSDKFFHKNSILTVDKNSIIREKYVFKNLI